MSNTIQPITSEQGAAELKAHLRAVRVAKSPTDRGILVYGAWLGACLKIKLSATQLDALEILWWHAHDQDGNLITTETTTQNRYDKEKDRTIESTRHENETNPQAAKPVEARS